MDKYHKIQTVFKRDPDTKFKTLLWGEFAKPEFEYLAACPWQFTEKVDGTNVRVMFDGDGVRFAGKTNNAQLHPGLLEQLNLLFPLPPPPTDSIFDGPACLYGEGFGEKIQKGGGNYRSGQGFVLFDVKVGDSWLRREDVVDVAGQFGIGVVPVIGEGTLHKMAEMVRGGFMSAWGNFTAEGIVARPLADLLDRRGDRIITKIKHKDFPK